MISNFYPKSSYLPIFKSRIYNKFGNKNIPEEHKYFIYHEIF